MRIPPAVAVAAVLVTAFPVAVQEGKPAAVPVVAVVDFVKVFEAYPRAIAERKKLEELNDSYQAMAKAEGEKIEALRLARDNFKPRSQEYALKTLELDLASRQLEGHKQIWGGDLEQRQERFLISVYEDIEQAVGMVAKARGVQLVLRAHNDLGKSTVEDKARVFERRIVWFAAPEVDLTGDVIKMMQAPLPELPKASAGKGENPPKGTAPASAPPKEPGAKNQDALQVLEAGQIPDTRQG
jgi:Skp family chaperone for outer membrane proteins